MYNEHYNFYEAGLLLSASTVINKILYVNIHLECVHVYTVATAIADSHICDKPSLNSWAVTCSAIYNGSTGQSSRIIFLCRILEENLIIIMVIP